MDQAELLQYVVATIERLRLPYLITGSVATTYYGEPRMTNDVDVVVRLSFGRIADFCQAFPSSDFYLSNEAVHLAVNQAGQFNIIHPASGLKVDVIVPADSPFNRSRFARVRRVRPAPSYEACFASPEDVIIKKLEYHRDGGPEKHLRDIAGVLKISGDQVDRAYVTNWATRLGLQDTWQQVLEQIGESRQRPERP